MASTQKGTTLNTPFLLAEIIFQLCICTFYRKTYKVFNACFSAVTLMKYSIAARKEIGVHTKITTTQYPFKEFPLHRYFKYIHLKSTAENITFKFDRILYVILFLSYLLFSVDYRHFLQKHPS